MQGAKNTILTHTYWSREPCDGAEMVRYRGMALTGTRCYRDAVCLMGDVEAGKRIISLLPHITHTKHLFHFRPLGRIKSEDRMLELEIATPTSVAFVSILPAFFAWQGKKKWDGSYGGSEGARANGSMTMAGKALC